MKRRMQTCNTLLGCYQGKRAIPELATATQFIRLEPGSIHQPLHYGGQHHIISTCNLSIAPSLCPYSLIHVPLNLTCQEAIQDLNSLLQRSHPLLQLCCDLCLVVTKFLVEVGTIWACLHRNAKNSLDDEIMMLLQGVAVRIGERG